MGKCNDLCSVFHVLLLFNFVTIILSFWKTLCLVLFIFLSCSLCFPDSFRVCSLGKSWGWGLCYFFTCLPSQQHIPWLSFDSHLCVGSILSLIQALFLHNLHISDDFKFKICTLLSILLSYFNLFCIMFWDKL